MLNSISSRSRHLFRRSYNLWHSSKRNVIVSKSILDSVEQSANTDSLWPQLREAVSLDPKRLIVLDDDPTGCQTVYDINVLLDYSVDNIKEQLKLDDKLFYILTNTRSLTEKDAIAVTKQVIQNIEAAKKIIGYRHQIQYISRGDSTLRGHHPAEVQAIAEALNKTFDTTIVMPAFFEGGRITFNDIHYVQEGDNLTPAGETPFAKDAHFGFSASNLRDWVVEKSGGTIIRENVNSVSLRDIREGGHAAVANILESQVQGNTVVINAVHEHDMNIFMLGLLQAETDGLNSIYRSAASFVASRAGLEPKGLLTAEQLRTPGSGKLGGLIVVGSYVPKTSLQLTSLLEGSNITPMELSVKQVIDASRLDEEESLAGIVDAAAAKIDAAILRGLNVVLYTTREFLPGTTLLDAAAVSDTLTAIVREVRTKPAFLVAKGGITSNDVASKSLNITTARVIGQILPGVPVWTAGEGSRFPGMTYIVFPGNVGDKDALLKAAITLGVTPKISSHTLPPFNYLPTAPSVSSSSSSSSSTTASSNPLSQSDSNMSHAVPQSKNTTSSAPAATSTAHVSTSSSKSSHSKLLNALSTAQMQKTAIAAFNVYNLEGAKAVVAAAEIARTPVILQVHPSSFNFGGWQLLDLLYSYRTYATVPVFIHIDHADVSDEETVCKILDHKCKVDSVMIDGSSLSLTENTKWTKKMARLAHQAGAVVEAELGRLSGEEDGMSVSEKEAKMTDPSSVAMYVRDTGVDMLAVTIGNSHGKYLQAPKLDFPRLELIRGALPAGYPLVLHGASGLSQSLIAGAMSRGVCKFNVNTDMRSAAMQFIRDTVTSNVKTDVLHLMQGTTAAMQEVALHKILLFQNKAGKNDK